MYAAREGRPMRKHTYTDPWDELEARANKYSAQALIAMVGVVIIVWLLTLGGFFIIDKTMMTRVALFSTAGFLSLLAVLIIVDNSARWLKYVVLSVICILCGAIVSSLSFHAVLIYVIPLIIAAQYTRKHVIWVTYAVNVVSVAVSSLIAFYHGFCDLNIFFVSMSDFEHFMAVAENGFAGLELNSDPTFIILVYATIPRALILALLSYILSRITEKGRAEAAQMARTKIISETDFVTGVYNKNKYTEMIRDYYPRVDSVGAVYLDVNNLKEINDSKGHDYGDKLITMLASAMLAEADDLRKVYRLGGDEFLALIETPIKGEEENYVQEVMKKLADEEEKEGLNVSVAWGTARGNGRDIETIVREADAAMYTCKRNMKK